MQIFPKKTLFYFSIVQFKISTKEKETNNKKIETATRMRIISV
jgi:hypothetical protein